MADKIYNSKQCWETHPPLKVGDYTIIGGKSTEPPENVDISISLDAPYSGPRSWPWQRDPLIVVDYHITNMGVPPIYTFRQLLEYCIAQMSEGKRLHVGCFAGHGRTGLLLSSLMAEIEGPEDAVQKVRTRYCHRVVESQVQVDFLHTHFKVPKVIPTYSDAQIYGALSKTPKSHTMTFNTVETSSKITSDVFYDQDHELSITRFDVSTPF